MVTEDCANAKVQNVFRVHHIASFVEGEHSLKPEEVVRHLKALQSSKKIDETPCMMKLDNRGIRIKLEKTKETVESFEWNGIRNQAAILNPMENFQYKYLVLFRLYQSKEKISELHVFSCETTAIAKAFVDSMSYHKKDPQKRSIEIAVKQPLRRGQSESKVNTVVDAYGQHFYMLNRCIDDIESFERQLEKAIKKRATPSKNGEGADTPRQHIPKPPSVEEFNEAVRKVKYAFNTNEAIRQYTPDRTSKKIFIRLFNTVYWLDEVCKSGCVPEYHDKMVSDVVEPLLNGDTIRAIMERLAPRKQEFWRSLGKAWNTPSEQWPNSTQRYMPQFETPPSDEKHRRTVTYEKQSNTSNIFRSPSVGNIVETESTKLQFSDQTSPENVNPERAMTLTVKSPSLEEPVQPTPHVTHPPDSPTASAVEITVEKEEPAPLVPPATSVAEPVHVEPVQQFPSKFIDNSKELYYVTIRHVSAKPREISVSPGSIVEVLDKSRIDWWFVKDQNGYEGEIPKWKLKPYTGSSSQGVNPTKILKTSHSFDGPSPSRFSSSTHPTSTSNRPLSMHSSAVTNNKSTRLEETPNSSPVTNVQTTANFTPSSPIIPITTTISTSRAPENRETTRTISMIASEPQPKTEPSHAVHREEVESTDRVISVTRMNESPVTHSQKPSNIATSTSATSTQPTASSAALGGSMIYMTSDQLQEIMKSSENLAQVPMVLVPVSELYKYASQTNLNVGNFNGTGGGSSIQGQMPMQWPDLTELGDRPGSPGMVHSGGWMPEWKPAPLMPTGSVEGLGFSPYPFNYPTHMHTMTRELRERLSKMREGGGTGLKAVPMPTTSNERPFNRLTKYASKDDIAEWLVARRFPPKVISSLKGFNGMDLYTMSRQQLAEHVGPERCDEIFYAFRGS